MTITLTLIITRVTPGSYGKMETVARKKKTKKFSRVEAVKALARERIGTPPAKRILADRKKKRQTQPKHKPTSDELLSGE